MGAVLLSWEENVCREEFFLGEKKCLCMSLQTLVSFSPNVSMAGLDLMSFEKLGLQFCEILFLRIFDWLFWVSVHESVR